MGTKTWIYITILIVVLLGAGIFFWWIYKTGKLKPAAQPPMPPVVTTFSDVGTDNAFYKEIEAVAKAGYMSGYREFKPEETISRGMAAALTARTYQLSYDASTPSFSDVPKTYEFYGEIEALAQAGWVDGYSDGTFRPDAEMNRATITVMGAAAKAGGKDKISDPPATVTTVFTDVTKDYWAFKYIYYAKENNLITGYSDGSFRPDNPCTRAMAAMIISRAHGDSFDNPTPTFTDVAKDYWAYKEIEGLFKLGSLIAVVGSQAMFKPLDIADRAQMASAVGRASNNIYDNPSPSFPDVAKDYWAYKEIEGLKKAEIMVGFGDGTFRPTEKTTRKTIAIVLARAKNLSLDNPPSVPTFVDVQPSDDGYKEIEAIYQAGYTKGYEESDGPHFRPDQELPRQQLAAFVYNAYIGLTPSPTPSILTPSPIPSLPSPTLTPQVTPSAIISVTPSPTTGATETAKTGPEIPFISGGFLAALLIARYLVNRRFR